ncbi:MAG: hypothetical protein Q7U74_01055, partial [Saprospiraceae bacterium]|nr:hypothetical protein [Saprospiraceae bacterium]
MSRLHCARLDLTNFLVIGTVVRITMDERAEYFVFVEHKYPWHLEAVPEIGIFIDRLCAMTLQYGSLEAPNPVHQPEELLWSTAFESKSTIKAFLWIANMVNRKEYVFFKEFFCNIRLRCHVYKNDPKAIRLKLSPAFRNITDGFPTERAAKKS